MNRSKQTPAATQSLLARRRLLFSSGGPDPAVGRAELKAPGLEPAFPRSFELTETFMPGIEVSCQQHRTAQLF